MTFSAARPLALLVLVLAACQAPPKPNPELYDPPAGGFDYRWEDPYVATVVGTPPDQQAALPETIPVEILNLDLFPERRAPPYFWYEDSLTLALSAQPGEAPLAFVISGTGGSATSRTTEKLVRVLYAGGFHVLAMPSPTYPGFVINGSSTGVPGRVRVDARDLYDTMVAVYPELTARIQISHVALTGFSLGAWHAAFVAQLDDREQRLNFQRVLMINPPVSLYRSMRIIDAMLVENLPGGLAGLPIYVNQMIDELTNLFAGTWAPTDFTGGFLYQAYQRLKPTDEDLAALIGLTFRLSALDLAFTADAVTQLGYIIPRGRRLEWTDPVTEYWVAGIQHGFGDYLDELLLPYYRQYDPDLSEQALLEEATLERLGTFLGATPSISLVTNEDDIIYAPGDLIFLRHTFGERGHIFPNGGHVGNIEYPPVVAAILTALAVGGEP